MSLAVQVHGGMGYIEETGIAQVLRDVRITSIYEGTTAIQANDLLGRKLKLDDGAALQALLAEAERELAGYAGAAGATPELLATLAGAREALAQLREASASLASQLQSSPESAYAVSVPYLRLCGFVLGGWLMARAAQRAAAQLTGNTGERGFLQGKLQSARFYAAQTLPQTLALARIVSQGGASVASADAELI